MGEAGLPPDAGTTEKGDLTIEGILEEKKVFDLSVQFERTGSGNKDEGWSLPGMPGFRPLWPSFLDLAFGRCGREGIPSSAIVCS